MTTSFLRSVELHFLALRALSSPPPTLTSLSSTLTHPHLPPSPTRSLTPLSSPPPNLPNQPSTNPPPLTERPRAPQARRLDHRRVRVVGDDGGDAGRAERGGGEEAGAAGGEEGGGVEGELGKEEGGGGAERATCAFECRVRIWTLQRRECGMRWWGGGREVAVGKAKTLALDTKANNRR